MHLRHLLVAASLTATLIAGCSVDDEDLQEQQTLPERRQKIGKADLWGSCDGPGNSTHCGLKSQGNCYCDKACSEFGDCCADYNDICGEPECLPIMCTLFCAYGFKKGPDGCEVCSCVQPEPCAGFANFPCPEGKTCIDDPTDSCDPNNGGADCGGICVEPSPCVNAGGSCHNGLALCGPGTTASSLECSNTSIEQTCCVPDAAPSCQGYCGGAAPGKVCYCDSVCTQYGDCCADYASVCSTERTPASGPCVKNSNEACTTDADCMSGGCGGELCYNPAFGGGISTCECAGPGAPVQGCGCVNNKCTWYN